MHDSKHCCRIELKNSFIQHQPDEGKNRWQLPADLGLCYNEQMELDQGLSINLLHYHPLFPLIEETNCPYSRRVMAITIALNGHSSYRREDSESLRFSQGYTTTATFSPLAGERRFNADEETCQLRVVATERLIRWYLGQAKTELLFAHHSLHPLAFKITTSAALTHARTLAGALRVQSAALSKIKLHIHALSLLDEQFQALLPPSEPPKTTLHPAQVRQIERVRQIMIEHLDQPLTLTYLASQVGIGKNKLRDGMRALYNQTPAALLLDLRMAKAVTLFESGLPVSVVCWQVGYPYANNFTVAFTRYFGQSPKAMFKTKS